MKVASLELFLVPLPFRIRFEHRAAAREESTSLLTRVTLADGTVGWGEGVPRPYVTGESAESSARAVEEFFAPGLGSWDPGDFDRAAAEAAGLPTPSRDGCVFNAARCAVELAILDAYGRMFRRPATAAAVFRSAAPPPEPPPPTAVLPAGGRAKVRWLFRAFRAAGIHDFKLKVGFPDDERRFRFILKRIGRPGPKRLFLRADANGAWKTGEAEERIRILRRQGVDSVEQPLAGADWDGLRRLAAAVGPEAIVLDESLLTIDDARKAALERLCGGFNIRISKNGGLFPSLEIARLAAERGIRIYVGAMVGESGLLDAARRHFLAVAPPAAGVEPSFSRFLLKKDLVRRGRNRARSIRSANGTSSGFGLGADVDEKTVARLGRSAFRIVY